MATAWPLHRIGATLLAIVVLVFAGLLAAAGQWLAGNGATAPAVGFFAWSCAVMFAASRFVRPKLISDGARLALWAVIFGVLGRVEAFGFVGPFLGPIAMALLAEWWRAEATERPESGAEKRPE